MNKVPRWLTNIAKVVVPALFLFVFIGSYIHALPRERNPRYTIGQVTETSYSIGPSSHSNARFTYTVNGRSYTDSSTGDVDEGCTRCLVKFAATDPENMEFYNHVCIPDSIREAPPEGWKEPPFAVPDGVR